MLLFLTLLFLHRAFSADITTPSSSNRLVCQNAIETTLHPRPQMSTMYCDDSCGWFNVYLEGLKFFIVPLGCIPEQLRLDLEAPLNQCTNVFEVQLVETCSCTGTDECDLQEPPTNEEPEILCYNGFWANGTSVSAEPLVLPCYGGACASIEMSSNFTNWLFTATFTATWYTCVTPEFLRINDIYERCNSIVDRENSSVIACGCATDNCNNPFKEDASTSTTTPSSNTAPANPCPDFMTHSTSQPNKCYYGVYGKETWWYARNIECGFLLSFMADMLSISNAFENSEIRDLYTNQTDEIWIGLQNIGGSWIWSDDSTSTYRNWASGEPKAVNEYAYLRFSDGKWYTGNILETRNFVCELPV